MKKKNAPLLSKAMPFLTTVLSFLVGAFWYSPYFLGKIWQKAVGFQPSAKDMAFPMIISFFLTFIMAYAMRWILQKAKVEKTYKAGFLFGLTLSLLFVATSLGIVYVYARNLSFFTLWAIDAGYQVTFLTLMATILAVW